MGHLHGQILQVDVPNEQQDYTTITYLLKLHPLNNKFTTYKSQIRRNIKIKEIEAKKEAKVELKRIELAKIRKEHPGIEIDEELFLGSYEPFLNRRISIE